MANNTEGQLVDLWNREEESAGLKGWLEENVSKKGLSKLYNKATEYQKEKMAEEVIPGLTEGQLYEGITGTIGGVSKKLLEIAKRTRPGESTLNIINERIRKYPKDKPWMAIAVDEEKRILQTLPKELFENKELLRKSIDKGEDFINVVNKNLGKSGQMYDESYIKDVLEHLYKNL